MSDRDGGDLERGLAQALGAEPRGEAVDAARRRLVQHAAARSSRARPRWVRRVIVAVAATLALATGAFAAAVPVASGSLPADTLYPVKLAGESVRLAFARGATADVRLHLEFAETRLDEMGRAVAEGRMEILGELARRYAEHVAEALALAGGDEALLARVAGALTRHQTTLAGLLAAAPDTATPALTASLEASSSAQGAVEALLEDPEETDEPDPTAPEGTPSPAPSPEEAEPAGADEGPSGGEPTGTPDGAPDGGGTAESTGGEPEQTPSTEPPAPAP